MVYRRARLLRPRRCEPPACPPHGRSARCLVSPTCAARPAAMISFGPAAGTARSAGSVYAKICAAAMPGTSIEKQGCENRIGTLRSPAIEATGTTLGKIPALPARASPAHDASTSRRSCTRGSPAAMIGRRLARAFFPVVATRRRRGARKQRRDIVGLSIRLEHESMPRRHNRNSNRGSASAASAA